jgi:hypothetical protein
LTAASSVLIKSIILMWLAILLFMFRTKLFVLREWSRCGVWLQERGG